MPLLRGGGGDGGGGGSYATVRHNCGAAQLEVCNAMTTRPKPHMPTEAPPHWAPFAPPRRGHDSGHSAPQLSTTNRKRGQLALNSNSSQLLEACPRSATLVAAGASARGARTPTTTPALASLWMGEWKSLQSSYGCLWCLRGSHRELAACAHHHHHPIAATCCSRQKVRRNGRGGWTNDEVR